MERTKISYGEHEEQYGHLYLPERSAAETGTPVPVVMIVHGGSWSGRYSSSLGTRYAVECARAGVAAWNIEYRRVGAGGLWPEVSNDVGAALDALIGIAAELDSISLDLTDIRVLGHSSGGHLAAWLAGRRGGALTPSLIVTQAGVLDLVTGPASGIVNPAVRALLDADYEDAPELYRSASPIHRIPTAIPMHCIHGSLDTLVPVSQSELYVAAASAAGDQAALTIVPGEDHVAFLETGSQSWQRSVTAVLAGTGR